VEQLQGWLASLGLGSARVFRGSINAISLEHRAQLRLVHALLGIACRLLHGRFCCFFDT
jgi:hypothetical protein